MGVKARAEEMLASKVLAVEMLAAEVGSTALVGRHDKTPVEVIGSGQGYSRRGSSSRRVARQLPVRHIC